MKIVTDLCLLRTNIYRPYLMVYGGMYHINMNNISLGAWTRTQKGTVDIVSNIVSVIDPNINIVVGNKIQQLKSGSKKA